VQYRQELGLLFRNLHWVNPLMARLVITEEVMNGDVKAIALRQTDLSQLRDYRVEIGTGSRVSRLMHRALSGPSPLPMSSLFPGLFFIVPLVKRCLRDLGLPIALP